MDCHLSVNLARPQPAGSVLLDWPPDLSSAQHPVLITPSFRVFCSWHQQGRKKIFRLFDTVQSQEPRQDQQELVERRPFGRTKVAARGDEGQIVHWEVVVSGERQLQATGDPHHQPMGMLPCEGPDLGREAGHTTYVSPPI